MGDSQQEVRISSRFLRFIVTLLTIALGGSALLNIQVGDITIATYIIQQIFQTPEPQINDIVLTQTVQAIQLTQTAMAGGEIQSTPNVTNAPIATATSLPTVQSSRQQCNGALDINEKNIPAGTIVIGDVIVNGENQFDVNANNVEYGFPEGTTVFFEVAGTVSAPFGATCFPATSLEAMWQLMMMDYENGCSTGCATERLVIVRESGTRVFYYPDEVQSLDELVQALDSSTGGTTIVGESTRLCPPNNVQKTGLRTELPMTLNVPAGYVQYLGGSRFDNVSGHVFVTVTGPYTGSHVLYEGAYCEPVQKDTREDELAENQITLEVEHGGVDCPAECQYIDISSNTP